MCSLAWYDVSMEKCPECDHYVAIHFEDSNIKKFQCWERNSIENNDFCGCQHGMLARFIQKKVMISATFYAVRAKDGLWWRSSSRNNASCWVKHVTKAKIYSSVSPARGKITSYANVNPTLPLPDIVELVVTQMNVVDQKDRVMKTKQKKQEEKTKQDALNKKHDLQEAQRDFDRAAARLNKLTQNNVCSGCGHAKHASHMCPGETMNGYSCRCLYCKDTK